MKCMIESLMGVLLCITPFINCRTYNNTVGDTGGDDEIITKEVNESSEKPQVFRDMLAGKFNGIDMDTLIVMPEGEPEPHDIDWWDGDLYMKWRIKTVNGTVPDLIVDETTGVRFIKEGDLDGNGTDEWGFISERYLSTWTCYNVYTYANGKWRYLVEPITICTNQIVELNRESEFMNPSDTRHYLRVDDIIRPSKKKGFVKTRECETINEATEWVVTEKTVRTKIN